MHRLILATVWILIGSLADQLAGQALPNPPLPPVPDQPVPNQTAPGLRPRLLRTLAPSAPAPSPQPFIVQPPLALPPIAQPTPAQPVTTAASTALVWDAESKEYTAKPGEASASFTFNLTNSSASEVSINAIRTSCGCTAAQLPAQPWRLPPGGSGPIQVTMDLRGKRGAVTKTVTIDSSVGVKTLFVRANIPDAPVVPGAPSMADRTKNMQLAMADRQAVFKGDCAACHVEPTRGKMGQELYASACGICHDAPHRASMVPDLKVAKVIRDLEYWKKWIAQGKPATLMPAFATTEGGPLTSEQIDSLAQYLSNSFAKAPSAAATEVTVTQ